MESTTGYVKVRQAKDGSWYWTLQARNNRILCKGQGYNTEIGAAKGAVAARTAFERFDWRNE